MCDTFISYVGDDFTTVKIIVEGLEALGFQTWYWHRDLKWHDDYLLAISKAIENSKGMVLIISRSTLVKHKQIMPEVVRANEYGKPILPVLIGITWDELKETQPLLAFALERAIGILWVPEHAEEMITRIADALRIHGIPPYQADSETPMALSTSEPAKPVADHPVTAYEVIDMFADLGLPVCDDADRIRRSYQEKRPLYLMETRNPSPYTQEHGKRGLRNGEALINHGQDLLEVVYQHFSRLADAAIKSAIDAGTRTFSDEFYATLRTEQAMKACRAEPNLAKKFFTRWILENEYSTFAAAYSAESQAIAPIRQAEVPGAVDRVHFSVTSPPLVNPGSAFVVDLWAHPEQQRQEVIQRARESLGGKEVLVKTKGPLPIARGTVLIVNLKIDGMVIEDPEDTILWEGEIGNASFAVQAPKDTSPGIHLGKAAIYADTVQIARIHFELTVALVMDQRLPEAKSLPLQEFHHRTAFASYASPDRDEVLHCIQGMQKAAPKMDIFMDVHSLRSGQNWEKELWARIPTCDVFFLFWSANARQSPWVEKEWRCALTARGIDFIDPVPLQPPEVAPPPPELASLHFNDWQLAYLRNAHKPV